MKIRQVHMKKEFDAGMLAPLVEIAPNVVIVFGGSGFFADGRIGAKLRKSFPTAIVVGCSTAGEIVDNAVYDGTLVVTGVATPNSKWFLAAAPLSDAMHSREVGKKLGRELAAHAPQSVFTLAPGLNINGSELVEGLVAELGTSVVLTGGLAGDGVDFRKTYTLFNETVTENQVVALGLKDPGLQVSYGTQGGWQPFGPYRRVTRAENNILYELDGKSALALYKEYLGDKAKDLPGSGLLYPLNVVANDQDKDGIVRSILNIDEADGSITLAGDVAQGYLVRLMHAKSESLIDGAERAGKDASEGVVPYGDAANSLGILVSCVGRKVVMGDDADDEVDAVKQAFGGNAVLTGFYSYGEISPFSHTNRRSTLHNQTMTITRLTPSSKIA